MSEIGQEFSERLFELGTLTMDYARDGSKRKKLNDLIPTKLAEFDRFCDRPEVQDFIKSFLQILGNHSHPTGESLDVTPLLRETADEFMVAEKSGTPLAAIKKADFEKLVERLARFNKRNLFEINRLDTNSFVKFLNEGLTEAFEDAKKAKPLPRKAKKKQQLDSGARAWLIGTGTTMSIVNAMLSLNPAFKSEIAITSMWLGMSGVGDGAFQIRSRVGDVIKEIVRSRK